MPQGNKKARQSLQAGRANAFQQCQFIKETVGALAFVAGAYLFLTFGLGRLFGII